MNIKKTAMCEANLLRIHMQQQQSKTSEKVAVAIIFQLSSAPAILSPASAVFHATHKFESLLVIKFECWIELRPRGRALAN